jgi:hypothetical protein
MTHKLRESPFGLLCRELELKMLKMQKTKEEMEAFHKERVAWKQKEKERMEEENR